MFCPIFSIRCECSSSKEFFDDNATATIKTKTNMTNAERNYQMILSITSKHNADDKNNKKDLEMKFEILNIR